LNPGRWFQPLLAPADPLRKRRFNRILFLLSLILASVLLYLALRGVDWIVFFTSLGNADFGFFPVVLLLFGLSYLLRAVRWNVLISGSAPAGLGEVFWAKMTGYLGNLLLPARAGELVRAVYLSRRSENTAAFLLATCLVEGVIDILTLVGLGSAALLALQTTSGALLYASGVLALAGFLGLSAVLLLPRFGNPVVRFLAGLRWLTEGRKERLAQWINHFLLGLRSLLHIRRIFLLVLATGLIWCLDSFTVVFLAYALHTRVAFLQAVVLLAGLGLSNAVPSTPGNVGVYQFVAVAVLEPFGIPRENALILILTLQALNVITVSALGGIGLWRVRNAQPPPKA
jgi:uncharacterized protein (TIRG00374 family)